MLPRHPPPRWAQACCTTLDFGEREGEPGSKAHGFHDVRRRRPSCPQGAGHAAPPAGQQQQRQQQLRVGVRGAGAPAMGWEQHVLACTARLCVRSQGSGSKEGQQQQRQELGPGGAAAGGFWSACPHASAVGHGCLRTRRQRVRTRGLHPCTAALPMLATPPRHACAVLHAPHPPASPQQMLLVLPGHTPPPSSRTGQAAGLHTRTAAHTCAPSTPEHTPCTPMPCLIPTSCLPAGRGGSGAAGRCGSRQPRLGAARAVPLRLCRVCDAQQRAGVWGGELPPNCARPYMRCVRGGKARRAWDAVCQGWVAIHHGGGQWTQQAGWCFRGPGRVVWGVGGQQRAEQPLSCCSSSAPLGCAAL